MRILMWVVVLLLIPAAGHAEAQRDSVPPLPPRGSKSHYAARYVLPGVMLTYGLLANGADGLKNFDRRISHQVDLHAAYRLRIDDYAQFAPAAATLGLEFMGVRARHSFGRRTLVMGGAYALMTASVLTLKYTTGTERPDNSNRRSFPSGHTATAFVGAHMLLREYGPWPGAAGYALAGGIGVMRVYNNKHWVSDVVTGAGIGILSVELSYLLWDGLLPHAGRRLAPASNGLGIAYRF